MNTRNILSTRETAIQQGRIGSCSFAVSYFAQLMLVGGNCEKQFLNTKKGENLTNSHNAKLAPEDEEILTQEEFELRIFPNPTTQNVTVILPYGEEFTDFVLMDNTGKRVLENNKLKSGKNEVDLSGLASGVYFYEVKVGSTVKHGKLVKQ